MKDGKRIQREEQTVEAMLRLYCKHHHGGANLCESCQSLQDYSRMRINRCPWGEAKGACSQCPVHCFRDPNKAEIRRIMAWAGPRMIWHHPILAIYHILDKRKTTNLESLKNSRPARS